ncbi:MAG: hypothetical protein FWC34_11170 [Bacteroidetes bacterium]|nr:hypothetical protein [Bacteroidota bacterium]MCL2302897.1 hypothetical protein [Lentimicrobiaceae bacterium]
MNVNFNRLLILLLPTFLRKGVLKSFLKAVSVAFQDCKREIDAYFKELNYHAQVTPQVFSLENMLNHFLDPIHKRIYITIPDPEPPFYFYEDSGNSGGEDNLMKYFDDDEYFLWDNTGHTHGFTVVLPLEMKSDDMTNYVLALLEKYKLLTKLPIIQYI